MLHRWRFRVVGLVLVCLALGTQFWVPSAPHHSSGLSRVNALWYDWRFQLLPPQCSPAMALVSVDIEEFTRLREGSWPRDRSRIAALIVALPAPDSALSRFD